MTDHGDERDRLTEAEWVEWNRRAGEWRERALTAETERDRLRAVVDAARMVLTVIDSTPVGQMMAGIEGHDEITLLRVRLDQLDVSAEATDG